MSDTMPGAPAVVRSRSDTDAADGITLGEIRRALKHVEDRTDGILHDLNGAGRDLGLRGAIVSLEKTVKDLDTDLAKQGVEMMTAISSQTLKVNAIDKQLAVLVSNVGKIDQKRLPSWALWVLFSVAVVMASAVTYGTLHAL